MDATNVSLIVDLSKLGKEFSNGYRCHPPTYDYDENKPSGLRSWPAIFSYPKVNYGSVLINEAGTSNCSSLAKYYQFNSGKRRTSQQKQRPTSLF